MISAAPIGPVAIERMKAAGLCGHAAPSLGRIDPTPVDVLRQADRRPLLQALLRHPLMRSIATFLAVGLVGLAVDGGVFTLLDARHVAPEWSRAASLAIATVVTWLLNRRLTFARTGRRPVAEMLRYGAVTMVAQGLNYGLFLALAYGVPAVPPLIWLVTGAVMAAAVSYVGHRFFAFAPTRSLSSPIG